MSKINRTLKLRRSVSLIFSDIHNRCYLCTFLHMNMPFVVVVVCYIVIVFQKGK